MERTERSSDYVKTGGERKMIAERLAEDGEVREKLPSKNSGFMARAGKDTVGEMRTEIEAKKRDRDTER